MPVGADACADKLRLVLEATSLDETSPEEELLVATERNEMLFS